MRVRQSGGWASVERCCHPSPAFFPVAATVAVALHRCFVRWMIRSVASFPAPRSGDAAFDLQLSFARTSVAASCTGRLASMRGRPRSCDPRHRRNFPGTPRRLLQRFISFPEHADLPFDGQGGSIPESRIPSLAPCPWRPIAIRLPLRRFDLLSVGPAWSPWPGYLEVKKSKAPWGLKAGARSVGPIR